VIGPGAIAASDRVLEQREARERFKIGRFNDGTANNTFAI
jgi:hypothetical protein